jgi:O-antigen/teichoic acid export membrane protein
MPNFITNFLKQFDGHSQELISGASVAFVLKIFAAGFAFALNVVLARLLGAEGSGVFFLAFTIVLIAAAIGRIGMEDALVRFIASNLVEGLKGKVLGVYKKALLYSLFISAILSILLYNLSPWISINIFTKPELTIPLKNMSLAITPLTILTLHAYALQGIKNITASISILSVFVPFITCLIAIAFVPGFGMDAAIYGYVLATLITLVLGRWFWKKSIRGWDTENIHFDTKELFSSSFPLFIVVMMSIIINWSPLLFLGIWESNENIGIYSAVSRTALLTSFVLVAVNSIAAPKFAELYKQGDMKSLEKLAHNSARIMMLFASPILFIFLFTPEWVLGIFGKGFMQGGLVLSILAVGQFVNVATGSVGYLLTMSGNEKLMRNNLIVCALFGVVLSIVLIKSYGIVGAAIAGSVTLAIQNLIAVFLVWKKLNIFTIVLPKYFFKK